MAKVTIEDISRHTGLSRGTVSRALNDRPDISELTKQRVLEACRDLRYVPSHAARSLATGRRYAVAVVVDDLHSALTCELLRGVMARARSERYVVHVSEVGDAQEGVLDYLASLINERVDGALIAGAFSGAVVERLASAAGDRPLVACTAHAGGAYDTLVPDYVEAGRLAARHILECVRNEVSAVLYVHARGSESDGQRREGFNEAFRAAGGVPDAITIQVPAAQGGDTSRLEPVRARLPEVRGVVASDDLLAVELMALAMQMGRQPGRDIAIMGHGNERIGQRITPHLTTIDFCGEELGRRAMEMALQRITKTRRDAPQRILVPPLLVERDSTRKQS